METTFFLNLLEDVLEGDVFGQEARQAAEGHTQGALRRGKCALLMEGVEETWTETLDRDFGQRLWTETLDNLMPEFSTLVPGGAADILKTP